MKFLWLTKTDGNKTLVNVALSFEIDASKDGSRLRRLPSEQFPTYVKETPLQIAEMICKAGPVIGIEPSE